MIKLQYCVTVVLAASMFVQPTLADQHNSYQPPIVTETMRATELAELNTARREANAHALSCENCVAIVFGIGDDIRADVHRDIIFYLEQEGYPVHEQNITLLKEQIGEQITDFYVQQYEDRYTALFASIGIDMEMFTYTDYRNEHAAVGSGVNFHIGKIFYHDIEDNNRTSFFANDVDADMVVRVAEALAATWAADPELRAQE